MYFVTELFEHEHFKDRFLNDVRTEEIVKKLYDAKVIPQRIQRRIERAEDDGDANSILYNHVQPQADMKSAKKLFEIMKAAVTYPEMSQLGAEMLDCFNQSEYLMCVNGIYGWIRILHRIQSLKD